MSTLCRYICGSRPSDVGRDEVVAEGHRQLLVHREPVLHGLRGQLLSGGALLTETWYSFSEPCAVSSGVLNTISV